MIQPPGFRGAAFSTAKDGDLRAGDRTTFAYLLGVSPEWATVSQVHGSDLQVVTTPGSHGEGDVLATESVGLPIAVFTADCGGIVLESEHRVAVAHAGWRGAVGGVVESAAAWLMSDGGVQRAALGPTIGPCCFEVGPEVAAQFSDHQATTSWGTLSVDLRSAIRARIPYADWWTAPDCARCGGDYHSHRQNKTLARMAAVGWLP
jgi:copper oxidase (laccase) domain-containing protein